MILHNSPWFICLPLQLNQLSSTLISRDTQSSYTTKLRADPRNTRGPVDRGLFPNVSKCPSSASKQHPRRLFIFQGLRWYPKDVFGYGNLFVFGRRRGLNKVDLQIDLQDYVTIVSSKTGNLRPKENRKTSRSEDCWLMHHHLAWSSGDISWWLQFGCNML